MHYFMLAYDKISIKHIEVCGCKVTKSIKGSIVRNLYNSILFIKWKKIYIYRATTSQCLHFKTHWINQTFCLVNQQLQLLSPLSDQVCKTHTEPWVNKNMQRRETGKSRQIFPAVSCVPVSAWSFYFKQTPALPWQNIRGWHTAPTRRI